jgi:hypothetical protein
MPLAHKGPIHQGPLLLFHPGAGLTLQSESSSAWASPIHLTGTHLPLDQSQTSAMFWRGRTTFFSLLE